MNHTIAIDGTVMPSFVECADEHRCGKFHEFVKLEDWDAS